MKLAYAHRPMDPTASKRTGSVTFFAETRIARPLKSVLRTGLLVSLGLAPACPGKPAAPAKNPPASSAVVQPLSVSSLSNDYLADLNGSDPNKRKAAAIGLTLTYLHDDHLDGIKAFLEDGSLRSNVLLILTSVSSQDIRPLFPILRRILERDEDSVNKGFAAQAIVNNSAVMNDWVLVKELLGSQNRAVLGKVLEALEGVAAKGRDLAQLQNQLESLMPEYCRMDIHDEIPVLVYQYANTQDWDSLKNLMDGEHSVYCERALANAATRIDLTPLLSEMRSLLGSVGKPGSFAAALTNYYIRQKAWNEIETLLGAPDTVNGSAWNKVVAAIVDSDADVTPLKPVVQRILPLLEEDMQADAKHKFNLYKNIF